VKQILEALEQIGRDADLLNKDGLAAEAIRKQIGLDAKSLDGALAERELLEQLLGARTTMFSALIPSEDDEEKKDDEPEDEGGQEEAEPIE